MIKITSQWGKINKIKKLFINRSIYAGPKKIE